MKKFAHRIILLLNILAVLALLLAYLAPFVNPARIFIPALFGLGYPLILLVNLGFVFYWMIRLRKELLLSLLVILIGWNNLNRLIPINISPSEVPVNASREKMSRVLSYNVRGFDRYNWSKNQNATEGIFDFIRQQDPDLLCLQEYYVARSGELSAERIDRELKGLPYKAVYHISDPSNSGGFGIATYSRFPIVKKSRIPFTSSSNAAMYTDLALPQDTIRVFNLHLQSIRFKKEDYAFMDSARISAYNNEQMEEIRNIGSRLQLAFIKRAEQAELIANYIANSPHPVLVMGDFNDTPQSYAYRRIKKGLKDAFRRSGRGIGHTYAGKLPSIRIDHILYSEPFVPVEFKRFRTRNSDHYPISCSLYLP